MPMSTDNRNPLKPRGINPLPSDIGRKVVYRTAPNYEAEEGVITSLAGPLVFVRYGDAVNSAGTSLRDLDWFMTHAEFDLERRKPRKEKTPMLKTLELLEKINKAIGWRGEGPHDTDHFYCEHCGMAHLDSTKIKHAGKCIVTKVREAIKLETSGLFFQCRRRQDRMRRAATEKNKGGPNYEQTKRRRGSVPSPRD